ncbi:inositol monophosphatase, partial [Buchnera aphidicola (Hormaphis cornu)]
MHPILNIAIRAIRQGGKILIQNYDTQQSMTKKITYHYKVLNNIIEYSEKVMSGIIHKFYPKHYIISQRLNNVTLKDKRNLWIINPLDGIINYSKYLPHFCITISVYLKGLIELSVIYDPLKNELFSSIKGQGSKLNGYRIRCEHVNNMNHIVVAINFLNITNNLNQFLFDKILKKLFMHNCYFRCSGSLALDFAYIASGRINCYIGYKDDFSNFAIGEQQIQESGGLVIHLNDIFNN